MFIFRILLEHFEFLIVYTNFFFYLQNRFSTKILKNFLRNFTVNWFLQNCVKNIFLCRIWGFISTFTLNLYWFFIILIFIIVCYCFFYSIEWFLEFLIKLYNFLWLLLIILDINQLFTICINIYRLLIAVYLILFS